MAIHLITFRPISVHACSHSSGTRKAVAYSTSWRTSSVNWWTPLFGWSSKPDYIDADTTSGGTYPLKPPLNRDAPGGFTEEKARVLRMMTPEIFHDKMYHSAVASRLASDFGNQTDDLQ